MNRQFSLFGQLLQQFQQWLSDHPELIAVGVVIVVVAIWYRATFR